MKVASMQPMQVVPASEEAPKAKILRSGSEEAGAVQPLEPVSEDALSDEDAKRESSRGVERFVQYLQRQKRLKSQHGTRRACAIRRYESVGGQIDDSDETVGFRVNKAA